MLFMIWDLIQNQVLGMKWLNEWIGLMNNIQACAREVVNSELIYV